MLKINADSVCELESPETQIMPKPSTQSANSTGESKDEKQQDQTAWGTSFQGKNLAFATTFHTLTAHFALFCNCTHRGLN